ncbi:MULTISPECIES: hypothetical protein [unclassified Psychrobacter]|uniref:hypothetical protein n=1 Tax=unclassified Psychrobacter TaxID=196806 RepID=UPI0018F5F26F|nr:MULTISPECIES: hypothetical protein [unclassified Psychrobacter]
MEIITTVQISADNQSDWEHYPVTLENWVAACHEEKKKKDISYAEIARRLGYARPSLSLALSGNYTGSTDKIAAAYVSYRTQVVCPYLGETVSRGYCVEHALSAAPTHNPAALRHWRACQGCEHKPDEGGNCGK